MPTRPVSQRGCTCRPRWRAPGLTPPPSERRLPAPTAAGGGDRSRATGRALREFDFMCGILVSTRRDKPFTHKSLQALRKRGPDSIGFWVDPSIALGHTRLSIIGLDERGAQPMENDRYVLAFNGEIYNYLTLRDRLRDRGIHVSGASDTEVLLAAWTLWGADVLTQLDGFWAFALLDKLEHTLTLVRDQFGIKPMYYRADKEGVVAASLLKSIVDCLPAPPSLDHAALSEYVRYQFTFGDKTFFEGIKKVMPGEIVTIALDTGRLERTRYEDILDVPQDRVPLSDAWIAETRQMLRECVVDSTISDTSFTTFCSGGLDSSLITALARPDVAYHCNYSDPDCNETFFAKQVVDGTDTRLFVVNAQEQFDLVEKLADIIDDFDEPTIGSVILPLDDLLAQVKRRYKVILTGTGGDELFGGYVRFQLVLGRCYHDSYKEMFAKVRALPDVTQRFEMTHRKGNPALYSFYEPAAERSFHDAFAACREGRGDLEAMLCFDRRYFLQGLLNIDDKMCGRH
ncbi:MAG: asparagine synthase (glutamine-hydrolyzing), partial [Myxococcales bacterium]|nr:asparagine synthase (glutamine-hydrolyzing) [Myxococcales bacterium]